MELALKKFLNNKADEELEFRMEQLEKILARQDPPWADDDFEAVKAIKAKKLEMEMKNDHLADLDKIDQLVKEMDKVTEAIKWRNYIEEFIARDVGISTIHPNMNPNQWRYPYGNVLK